MQPTWCRSLVFFDVTCASCGVAGILFAQFGVWRADSANGDIHAGAVVAGVISTTAKTCRATSGAARRALTLLTVTAKTLAAQQHCGKHSPSQHGATGSS
jgi:hypothetical protein